MPLNPPAQLPTAGLALLLDAGNAALTMSNGSEVTEWRDASGSNRNAVTLPGRGPVLVTGALGGDAVLRFDGQNDYLDLPAAFADFTSGMTLLVVARPASVQAGSKLLLLGNGAGQANVSLGRNGGGAGLQYFTTNSGGNYGWFGTADALTSNEAALYTVVQAGGVASSAVQATVSKNGIAVGSGQFMPPVVTRSTNYIGRSYWGGDGYFAGDIAEIIVYNRTLTASELAAVQGYLAQKYSLAVAEEPPPVPLAAPGGLGATAGNGQVGLSWGAVNSATGYKLYRRVTTTNAYAQIHAGAATSYIDSGVSNGMSYDYVVRAYDSQRESVDSALVQATPQAPLPLNPPAQLPTAGLALLLDAGNAALTMSNGSEVTEWRDASGSNKCGDIAGTWTGVGDGALGGDAVLRFDGQNDYLDLPAAFADFTSGMTLLVVARPASVQAGSKLLLLGNGAGQANVSLGRNGGGAGLQYFTTNSGGNYGWFGTADALTSNEAALYTVVQAGGVASSAVQATVSKNGIAVGSGTVYVPPVVTRSTNYIGRSYWGGDGYFAER
ncbi:MAG: hypothetical protein IPI20_18955 [Rhodoferax sp.]|nr:hypothetical protein [Rhodoferax sp.]